MVDVRLPVAGTLVMLVILSVVSDKVVLRLRVKLSSELEAGRLVWLLKEIPAGGSVDRTEDVLLDIGNGGLVEKLDSVAVTDRFSVVDIVVDSIFAEEVGEPNDCPAGIMLCITELNEAIAELGMTPDSRDLVKLLPEDVSDIKTVIELPHVDDWFEGTGSEMVLFVVEKPAEVKVALVAVAVVETLKLSLESSDAELVLLYPYSVVVD